MYITCTAKLTIKVELMNNDSCCNILIFLLLLWVWQSNLIIHRKMKFAGKHNIFKIVYDIPMTLN